MISRNVKKIASFLILASSTLYSSQALAATRQQLDRLTLAQVVIVYNHELSNARIVLNSCYQSAATYPIMKSTCDSQKLIWEHYFAQFQLYIQQRRLMGR